MREWKRNATGRTKKTQTKIDGREKDLTILLRLSASSLSAHFSSWFCFLGHRIAIHNTHIRSFCFLAHAHQLRRTRVLHTRKKQTYSPIQRNRPVNREIQTHTCTSNIINNDGYHSGSSIINRAHMCMDLDKSTPHNERSIKRTPHLSSLDLYVHSKWTEHCRHQFKEEEEME